MTAVERLGTEALAARRDAAYGAGDRALHERCEDELTRREDEDEEPHEDSPALDPPWWAYR